jgi:transcriptional regulator with XRE-family HTH domain
VNGDLNTIVIGNVRRLRKARKWSAQRLVEALAPHGVPLASRSVLANWETGRREGISVDDLAALGAVFEVDPWSLTDTPHCLTCQGEPPAGYACLACGQHGGPR